jgi:H/ACA ribonucleoprotein complex subunit 2
LPVLCEEANVPYIYVPSKQDLGSAGSTKRPTSCMMVLSPAGKKETEHKELFEELMPEIKDLNSKIITIAA